MELTEQQTIRVTPRRFGLARRAVFRSVEWTVAMLGGRRFYRHSYLRRGRFRVREERVCVEGLAPDLVGFKIAHLSDIHAGPFLAAGDLEHIVASINAAAPDLIALTGDFITHDWREALVVLPELAALQSTYGTLAVFGNHDYRGRQEQSIAEEYEQRGIRFLRNDAAFFSVGRSRVALVGVEDLEEGTTVDVEHARRDVRATDLEIVLCHNPMGAPLLAREQCALVLSGHTHAGQIDMPFLRALGPTHPGLRVDLGVTSLVVNRGIGVVGVPLRVGAPVEWVLLELTAS